MVGLIGNKITLTPLEQVTSQPRSLDLSMYQTSRALEK
jgi:hypothetical protein